MTTKIIDTDVLVIGGGSAGCWAAISAKESADRVILIDKAVVARSGASTFTNSQLAPTPEGERDSWLAEIVEAGEYLNDQEWVRTLLLEQRLRVEEMAGWGVPFERDDAGGLRYTPGRGHKNTRMIMCNGHRLMEAMKKKALASGVELIPRVMAVELLTSDGKYPTQGKVIGAVGFHTQEGDFLVFRAGAVVLTTGIMDSKLKVLYSDNLTGDGPAMGYRAGADLMGMEFCMVPKITRYEGKYYGGGSSLLQGFGAKFINGLGEEVTSPELKNRARIGYLCQAFAKEHYEGRDPVCLDMTMFTPEQIAMVKKLLPSQMKPLLKAGVDFGKHPLVIDPVISIGSPSGQAGIRIDTDCRSSLPGLFAAGAAARNTVHGTYSVGGINMAFNNVSGYRAGRNAARYAKEVGRQEPAKKHIEAVEKSIFAPLNRAEGMNPDEAIARFHKITIPAPVSIFKREKRLKEALAGLRILASELGQLKAKDVHELVKAREIINLVLVAELVFMAALERKESRDTHYREDYPYRDDREWLKWIIMSRGEGDEIRVRQEPVPFDRYPLKPMVLQRIPHPVQYSLGEDYKS